MKTSLREGPINLDVLEKQPIIVAAFQFASWYPVTQTRIASKAGVSAPFNGGRDRLMPPGRL